MQATKSIPIVMLGVGNHRHRLGELRKLRQRHRIELSRRRIHSRCCNLGAAPQLRSVAVFINPSNGCPPLVKKLLVETQALGMQLQIVEVSDKAISRLRSR
jgi:hypothetical protein